MEPKFWLAGQIAIDVFMFILLLLAFKMHVRKRFPQEDLRTTVERSENCLRDLKEIGVSLERNLEEKRDLSRGILSEMDRRLQEAQTVTEELRQILAECRKGAGSTDRNRQLNNAPTAESIQALLARGLNKEEISKYLNVPAGELELILKFRPPECSQES